MSDLPVLVLTGTSRGIGRHLAEHYLADGWIVAGCSRSETDIDHENFHHTCLDITDEKEVIKWVRKVSREQGRIDATINNAGAASMNHICLTPAATVDRLMDLNFKGTFLVSRESAKVMMKRKYGRIVNFSSVAVPLTLEGEAVYVASKSAVTAFSQAMAREVVEHNITVNVVAPPPIDTALTQSVPKKSMDRLLGRMCVSRYGQFEDVHNVTDFFLKPDSSMVTGQVIALGVPS
ncbi:SDR family oxidoreductase [Magnetovibrio sp. PR-2]|uniref:SDR family NAD(P)-dependent oxidoreductase n=1 Tax=Magnetovibrio sp. PR-2 TaxID=3120356 RepID=UPI002FCE5F98